MGVEAVGERGWNKNLKSNVCFGKGTDSAEIWLYCQGGQGGAQEIECEVYMIKMIAIKINNGMIVRGKII